MHNAIRQLVKCVWVVTVLTSAALAPSRQVASQSVGYSLRFYGHGVDDADRVKISVDDPATTLPGPAVDVGGQDFTIEFWMRGLDADNNPAINMTCGTNTNWMYGSIILDRDRFSLGRKFGISFDQTGRVAFGVTNDATQSLTICGTTNALDGQWHHVALQRRISDGWMWLYVDGALQAQADGPDGDISYPDDATPSYRGPQFCQGPANVWAGYCRNEPFIVLGAEKHDAGQSEGNRLNYPAFSGWLDELRISTVLRYATAFPRPVAPFQTDAVTAGLYHFDEGPLGPCMGIIVDSALALGGPSNGQCFYGGAAPAGPEYAVDTPVWVLPTTSTATPMMTATWTPQPVATATPTNTPTPQPTATNTTFPTSTPTSGPTPPAAAQIGSWASPFNWPEAPIHMMLQTNGTLLVWDSSGNSHIWNPATNSFTTVPFPAADLFCAGHTTLADGRSLIVGGHNMVNYYGIPATHVFDNATNTFVRQPDMSYAGWYPTTTNLPDGRVLAVSGWINPSQLAQIPEIYNPATNSWQAVPTANLAVSMYSFMFVLPDGTVFNAGPGVINGEGSTMSRRLDLTAGTWSNVGNSIITGHSAVMYEPGRVMKSGTMGDPDYPASTTHGRTVVIDMNQPAPAWRETAAMSFPRSYHTLVLLPNGNTLVVGGERSTNGQDTSQAVYEAEMWNPATETWTTMAAMQRPRLYHSTAVLLPDGRVLSAGGDFPPYRERSAQIYSPPYLFAGPRPIISSAPASAGYNSTMSIGTPDAASIAKVSLIRLGSVTHGIDMSQRYVPLSFATTPGGLNVQSPASPNLAPPGYYMLFLINGQGVPSVASIVRLDQTGSPTATPTPAQTPTTTATNTPQPTPTNANTPQPTATNTATPTSMPTPALSDAIFADGFEAIGLGAWSSAVTDGDDIDSTTTAALIGARGLDAWLDDNNAIYVTDDRPAGEPRYRARFYFDPNAIGMAANDAHYIFYGYSGASTVVLRVEFGWSGNSYRIRASLLNDATSWTASSWFNVSDAPHYIEVDWRAATAAGANNGGLTLWIDGTQRADLTGVDNDTRRMDRVRLGAIAGIDSGTRGGYFFDAFESRRQTYIGPVGGATATPTPVNTPVPPTPAPPTSTPTLTPTPTPTTAANYALQFDGSNDFAITSRTINGNAFTAEAWVRPGVSAVNGVVMAEASLNAGWSIELENGRATLWVATDQGWQSVQHSTVLVAGAWTHIAATYNAGAARIHVNGVASAQVNMRPTFQLGPNLRMGGITGYPFFNGAVDDVRISNTIRYSANFTPPQALPAPNASVVGQWTFAEGSGQATANAVSGGIPVTLGGTTAPASDDPAWIGAAR